MTKLEHYHSALRRVGGAASQLADAIDQMLCAAADVDIDGDDPVAVEMVTATRERMAPLFRAHPDLLMLLGYNFDAPRKEGN